MPETAKYLACLLITAGALFAQDRPPRVIDQAEPEYPFSMRLSGNVGQVVLEFNVDPHGSVAGVDVISSSHPDFEAPAVEALLKWRFAPGMRNGVPVWTHMRVPILFTLTNFGGRKSATIEVHTADGVRLVDSGGVEPWQVPSTPPSGVPPEYRYDEPPKPQIIGAPVYPYDLLIQKVSGKASVTFAIDPEGHCHLVKLQSATRPEFGEAAAAMVESWQFEPAKKEGKPCWALLGKEEEFSRDSQDFPMDESTERLLKVLRKDPHAILSTASQVASLDRPVKARFSPAPIVPFSVRKLGSSQKAVIEIIIDHAGHARLPRIVSASNEDFAWAAATAVGRWQFTVPALKGKPVDVRERVPIVYSAEKAALGGT